MSNKFEGLARFGYAARGAVYVLLGGLTFTSALMGGSTSTDSSSALSSLTQLPFGRILLGLVAVGLLGHILWRLSQGLLDADNVGTDAKGLVGRTGSIISAGTNIFLMLTAAGMAIGNASGSDGGGGETEASGWLLQQPFGALLLGLVALCVIGAGCVQIGKGVSASFRRRVEFPAQGRQTLDFVCRFGLIARGVLIVLVGCFTFYAAWTVSPEEAGGISDALNYVHGLPFGRILFGLTALGLAAFGAYSIVLAFYRRMDAPSLSDVKRAIPG